jgi:UDP-N-acetylmuramoyl-tripeptide--D-alanyl-D-alanine ligase
MEKTINSKNMKQTASSGSGVEGFEISPENIKTDTRLITSGDFFIPLVGENFDGHDYIDKALEKGAIGAVYDPCKYTPKDRTSNLLPVTNTLKAYQEIAALHRNNLTKIKTISLTGSSGKTTVKELLQIALSEYGKTKSTEKNYNNEIGVPKTLLGFNQDLDFGILEMGARHLHDIAPLVKISGADVSILTNVGESHIGEFGSLDNIYKTKLEILTDSAPGNLKIGPSDDDQIIRVLNTFPNHLSVGFSDHSNIKITDVAPKSKGMSINYTIGKKTYTVSPKIYHEALPINIGYVLATVYGLGYELDKAIAALSNFTGLEGRFQSTTLGSKEIIDDAYNANLESMIMGLTSFNKGSQGEKSVLILGDMLELGEKSSKAHLEVGKFVQEHLPHTHLITVGSESENIAKGALSSGFDNNKISQYSSYKEVIQDLDNVLSKGAKFYLKSSNGTGLHKVVKAIKEKSNAL